MTKEEKIYDELNESRLNELKRVVFDCGGSLGVLLDNLYKLSNESPKDCKLILDYISDCLGREIKVSEILNLPEEDLKKIGVDVLQAVQILNSNGSENDKDLNNPELSLLDIANVIGEDYKHGRR